MMYDAHMIEYHYYMYFETYDQEHWTAYIMYTTDPLDWID